MSDLLNEAWAIVANVNDGDWSKQSPEWQAAANAWRIKVLGGDARPEPPALPDGQTRMDNPPAAGAPKNWKWGYLRCGCCNDGYGRHAR